MTIQIYLSTNQEWKNHGKYVSSVAKTAQSFVEQGLITEEEKGEIISGWHSAFRGRALFYP
jgi:hypothetical protein